MLCIGCECHGLPGGKLLQGFEATGSIEAKLSVSENVSFSANCPRVQYVSGLLKL